MPKTQKSNVDAWLERKTEQKRKALESASRYFDASDNLTVNTIEAVYGQESSFGTKLGKRGIEGAAGQKKYGITWRVFLLMKLNLLKNRPQIKA